MKAICIATDLLNYLQKEAPCRAQVHSVFRSSLNLLSTNGEIISLAIAPGDIMPMGLILDKSDLPDWPAKPEDWIILEADQISFANPAFTLPLQTAFTWEPRLLLKDANIKKASCAWPAQALQVAEVLQNTPSNGISPLISLFIDGQTDPCPNPYCHFIAPQIKALYENLITLDLPACLDTAHDLIGFGPGLTPSCDDFLSAVLSVFFYAQDYYPDAFSDYTSFSEQLVVLANANTTRISAAMLAHSAQGKLSARYQDLLASAFLGEQASFPVKVLGALDCGDSSGADFLLGFYCALTALIHQNPLQGDYPEPIWQALPLRSTGDKR